MSCGSFPRCGMCCVQSPRKLNRHCVSFIAVVAASGTNMSFALNGMSWHIPDLGMCRNFTDLTRAWIFVEFVSLPLKCICLTKVASMPAPYPARSSWCHQCNVSKWYSALCPGSRDVYRLWQMVGKLMWPWSRVFLIFFAWLYFWSFLPDWNRKAHIHQINGCILRCCCSVLCLTLCNPMDCSTPGFPVLHYFPEFAQTHIHWVGDAIQPSHPLLSLSPPAFGLSQHQGLFQWVSSLQQVARVLELQTQHQSFQWIFRVDFLWDWLVWSPGCPRGLKSLLQHHSLKAYWVPETILSALAKRLHLAGELWSGL